MQPKIRVTGAMAHRYPLPDVAGYSHLPDRQCPAGASDTAQSTHREVYVVYGTAYLPSDTSLQFNNQLVAVANDA